MTVNFAPKSRQGSRFVDVVVVGADGKFVR
jgi:hypothetical protein